jgi:hypothetical protein
MMNNLASKMEFYLPSIENLASLQNFGNPVITSITHEGVVIPISFFHDLVWDFRSVFIRESAHDSKKKLDWDIYPFNDILYNDLSIKAKIFIYSLWSDPIEHLKIPKPATIQKKFDAIKSLCRWLAISKYFDFSHQSSFYEYSAYLKTSNNSDATIGMKLAVIRDLYHQSCKIPLIGLNEQPWQGDDPMAGRPREPKSSLKISYIPDDTVQEIVSSAISVMEEKGSQIIAAVRAMKAAESAANSRNLHSDNVSRDRGIAAKKSGFAGCKDLNRHERALRDSCYICILFFSGMRQSEVLSIKTNPIRVEEHANGETVLWLDATLYKTSSNADGEPAAWIVPDVVKTAVGILEELRGLYLTDVQDYLKNLEREIHAGLRVKENMLKHQKATSNFTNLFLTYDSRSNSWGTVSGKTLDKYLKIFCETLDIKHVLSSHQFRHTFARMVARHELGDLHYLRVHFKHWSQDMTNYYAGVASNNDIFDEIAAETLKHKETIIQHLLESDEDLFGKRGEEIQRFRGTIINDGNIEIIAKSLAADTYLRGNGHSWCISTPGKQCSGICVYDRTICTDCDNAVMEKHLHLPVWHELRNQLSSTLPMTEVNSPARKRAEMQLAKMEKQISRMSQ